MRISNDDLADDEFSQRIAAFDDALVRGEPAAGDAVDEALAPELKSRLERAQHCLRTLNDAWRRPETDQAGQSWTDTLPHFDKLVEGEPMVQVGRFRIVRELGRGGYGVVFLAVDQLLGREVALKVPRSEALLTPQLRRRFLREAVATANLSHPSLLSVYEAGEIGPFCYIASAYFPGKSLAELLTAGHKPGSYRAVAELIARIADGVEHAHAHGVLHRDIKPSNVLLEFDPPTDAQAGKFSGAVFSHPRLTDFGLAKLMDGHRDSLHTPSATIIGTPGYMAPEQAAGNLDEVGPRADIYSLGAMLYELITGRPPVVATAGRAAMKEVLLEEPPLPRKLAPCVPRDLEAVCLRALEKDPARRYANAAALAADLRRFAAGEATEARPLGRARRIVRCVRRQLALATLLSIVAVGIVTIPLAAWWHYSQLALVALSAEQERIVAETLRREAEAREQDLRRRYYVASVRLADESLRKGNPRQATELLSSQQPRPGEADLRGFAWHYLLRMSRGAPLVLAKESQEVRKLTFSGDGKLLAAAGRFGSLKIWNVAARQAAVLPEQEGATISIAFSPDGKTLVSAGSDGAIYLWDVTKLKVRKVIRASSQEINCLVFTADGSFLAAAGRDGAIRIWKTSDWSEQVELPGHQGEVQALAFSPNGTLLASGGADRRVLVWTVGSAEKPLRLAREEGAIPCLGFSHDGAMLVTTSDDRSVKLWDVATGTLKVSLPGHAARVKFAEFSHDDKSLVTLSTDGLIRIWDSQSGTLQRLERGHDEQAVCATFSPRDLVLATSSAGGDIKLWDLTQPSDQQVLPETAAQPWSLSFSHDNRSLAVGGVEGSVSLFDVQRGALRLESREHTDRVMSVAFSPDDRRLASSSLDGTVRIWDPATAKVVQVLKGHQDGALSAAFSKGGDRVATASGAGAIVLWNAQTAAREIELQGHTGPASALVFADDGKLLASGGYDGTIKLWNLASPGQPIELAGAKGKIESIDVSPRSMMLAAGGDSKTVYVWNIATRKLIASSTAHRSPILSLSFGPTGRSLVTADKSGVVKLWNAAALGELVTLADSKHEVAATAFSPDGLMLATGSRSPNGRGAIVLWFADARP